MAVKKVEKEEAFCDICGRGYADNCAACNSMVCCEHRIEIRIRRLNAEIIRVVCPDCLGIAIEDIISGNDPNVWKGDKWRDNPESIKALLFEPVVPTPPGAAS